jgi:hydrogenase maturation protease
VTRLLIIGYGNPLRGDDAVGALAAERLREILPEHYVTVLSVHQLTPELMEPVSRARRVLFLDAALGPVPGAISHRPVTPAPSGRPFTHFATCESLLAGTQALYGTAPPANLFTITGAQFEAGSALSEPARKALEVLVDGIARSAGELALAFRS